MFFPSKNKYARWPRNGRKLSLGLFLLISGATLASQAAVLPTGAQVAAGQASVVTSGSTLTVRQTTDRASINWKSFSVGTGDAVNFVQPSSSSITLNRVMGSDPSVIQGSVTANGKLFFLNPNGIVFTSTSQVNVGGIVASTLDLSDNDFMAGRFVLSGASSSAVINQGNITAMPDGRGGVIAMVAAKVTNEGSLTAEKGEVYLAAGSKVRLDFGGVVGLFVEQGVIDALVVNGGAIRSPGGNVLLTAQAAGELSNAMVNHSGTIEAQTLVTGEKGKILLLADMQQGTVKVSGKLDVSAPLGGDGGFVETSAAGIDIADSALVTSLSAHGLTGTWLIDPDVLRISTAGIGSLGSLPATGQVSISPTTLDTALTTTNVDLQANTYIDFVDAFTYSGMRDAELRLYAPVIKIGADIGSSTDYNLGLTFGGTYAGNLTNYAGDVYLYDQAGALGVTRTLTTKGGNVTFNGNIGGAHNLVVNAGGGTITHNALVDGNFTAYDTLYNATASFTYKPGAVNHLIEIDFETQTILSDGVPLSYTGIMPIGFIRLTPQTIQMNAQKNISQTDVFCVMTLTDGTTVTFTPESNGDVVVSTDLQVKKIDYYTSNASASTFIASDITYDIPVTATKLLSYKATGALVTLAPTAALNISGDITLVTDRFVNLAGASALDAGTTGIWRVWSANPDPFNPTTGDINGGLLYDFKQYNLAYTSSGTGLLGTGDGLIYTYAPNLTVSLINTIQKTYDGLFTATNLTNANYSVSGMVDGDAVTFTGLMPTNGTYASKDVGTGILVSVTGIALSDLSATNLAGAASVYGYGLPSSTASGNIGIINQAALTVTAANDIRTYSGVGYTGGNGVSYVGFVNGETSTVLGGSVVYSGTSQGAINVGSYVITPSGLTSGNYAISYVDGTLTINKTALTVTALNDTRAYSGVAYTGGNGVSYTGFVNGETSTVLGGTLVYSGTSQGAINVGSYVITPSGLTSGNYDITFANGSLTINKATLTITALNDTKTYNGLAYSGGNGVNYTGFVDGDTSAVLGGTLVYGGTSQGATNVGSYVITPSGLTSGNYDISFVDGTLTINKAALTITALDDTKIYSGVGYAGGNGVSYTGFVNGETSGVLGGSVAYSGTSQGAINVGGYVITPSGLTSSNYDITFANGSLTINKAALTVTALDDTKIYSGVGYAGGNGVSYTGFVNGETSTVLGGSVVYGGTSQGAINVGGYVITPSGLTSGNYDITFANGSLTINKAALTVTALDDTKIYSGVGYSGGNGVSYTGFVNGETSDVLSGSVVYSGTSQGAINVGSYVITPSGLTSGNYDITFANGSLTINKAALTVTALDDTKIYSGVGYSGGNGVSYTGFVNGETSAVLSGSVVYSGTSQGAINVGSYVITTSGLTSGNYDITFANGSLTISKAALTVTAANVSKAFDGLAYSGGNGVSYTGFVNGETSVVLGGTLVYGGTSQGAVSAGSYTIVPSGLTSGNYNISFVSGILSIFTNGIKVDPLLYLSPKPPHDTGIIGLTYVPVEDLVISSPPEIEIVYVVPSTDGVESLDENGERRVDLNTLPPVIRGKTDVFVIKGGLNTGNGAVLVK